MLGQECDDARPDGGGTRLVVFASELRIEEHLAAKMSRGGVRKEPHLIDRELGPVLRAAVAAVAATLTLEDQGGGIGREAKLSEASTLRVEYLDHDDLDIVRVGLSFRLGRY